VSASPPAALGYFFGIDTYQLEATAIADKFWDLYQARTEIRAQVS